MDIRIALDGSRHRNLSLNAGDDQILNVIVYAKDTDPLPMDPTLVTDVKLRLFGPASQALLTATPFVVSPSMGPRNTYSIQATVNGLVTTIAYGVITLHGALFFNTGNLSYSDYGWIWPYYGIAPWP